MIEITDIYKEIENDGKKADYLEFDCEQCNQSFNQYGFSLSLFLYGVVFMVGKEFGYIGITCPSCLNTILIKGASNIQRLQQDMALFSGPNSIFLEPEFRYYSSILHTPNEPEYLDSFDIQYWNTPISEVLKDNFDGAVAAHDREQQLIENGYLGSYLYGSEPPLGAFASAWWYRPEDIEKLAQIENEQRERVFPRYVHKMKWYDRYDHFCWRYKLYQDQVARLKKDSSDNANKLREYAYQEDINLDRLYESNPGITSNSIVEFLEAGAKKIAANDIQVASEFLDLIVNFNPVPWDVPGPASDFYNSIYRTVRPFSGVPVPVDISEIDSEKYSAKIPDADIKDMVDGIRKNIRKRHVQEWAFENHQPFIEEYISLVHRPDFSYAYVWDLKCRYLQQLHRILDKASIRESRFAMYQTGPTWTIIYDGNEIAGLERGGHKYIHYLILHPNDSFLTADMDNLINSTQNTVAKEDYQEMVGGASTPGKKQKLSIDEEERYVKALSELREHRDIVKRHEEMEKDQPGSSDVDPASYKESKAAVNRLIKEYENRLEFGGAILEKGEMTKKAQDRISKSIRRAVNELKEYDIAAFEHFSAALKPIFSANQSYRTINNIHWETK